MRLNKRHEQIIPGYRKHQNPDFTGMGREKKTFWKSKKIFGSHGKPRVGR